MKCRFIKLCIDYIYSNKIVDNVVFGDYVDIRNDFLYYMREYVTTRV